MSQAAQATAPPPPAPAPTPASGAVATTPTPAQPSQTPRRLRLLTIGVLVAGLLFGIVGGACFALQARALSRAEANAEQLVRVQQIQTDLLSADATATNAFLVGGLEPPAQRARYDQLISETSELIAAAADAQPADADALAALNDEVVTYASTIELARANNRQGFPVGAQYLRTASAGLRADALPILDTLVAVNAQRAADEMDARPGWWFEAIGVLLLAGFVLTMIFVARTFRRTINVGLLTGGVIMLVLLVGGAIALGQTGSALNGLKADSLNPLTAAAQARIRGNDAKANESLTLISRGSGAAFEQAWKDSAAKVDDALGTVQSDELTQRWTGYTTVHGQIRKLDDGGQWDAAVALATGTGDDSANATFGAFDDFAVGVVDGLAGDLGSGLRAPRTGMIIAAILALAAGVAAALFGRRGLALRLREYR
ncbi:hypothetical protein [Microlunatus ginsengisoli]|uniref:Chemotaxis methyl-accepting receptor HlyB-like 4HB MCP domain-containing protein n=1 Tax=Microlunatus ginsengisoli TaxID=363863 RepID=A0ABP7A0C1_9ACTN